MDRSGVTKIYAVLSYLFLIAACIVAIYAKAKGVYSILPLWGLLFAILFKMLQERSHRKVVEVENLKLKDDLRKLTHILESLKKDETEEK